MGEAVVCFLVERVSDLLNEEAEYLHGVREPVEEIVSGLRQLQVLLRDAGARRDEERIRTWAADVRNLVYDATDILESFVIRITSKRRVGKITLKSAMNECLVLHKMRRERKTIKRRMSRLRSVFQTFGITSLSDSGLVMANSSQLVPVLDRTYNSTYPNVADPEVIGLERDIDYLVGHLVNDNQNKGGGGDGNCCRFISILGMGGLGKTTLARKIYNHPAIIRHFDCLSWVCISQQWQTNDVLQRILLNLTEKRNEVLSIRDEDELGKQISNTLTGKRYLVVLDDIWSPDVWDCIKAAFPFENMSSKILLTTRKTEVAQRVGLEANLLHEPKLLNDEQSWELLKKKTCITGYRHTDPRDAMELERLGREMIRRCRGLPLAILVLGGILATKPTLTQWEMVHKEIGTEEGLGQVHQKEVEEILISSYYDLPDQLKPCFMYMSKFPEDSEIEAARLYQLWMAEGMLLSKDRRDGETMMDVAESYLGELSQRCMIQVQVEEDESSVRKFRSCRLHDLMRDLSLKKAKEEDFFRVSGNNYNQDQYSPRLLFCSMYRCGDEAVHTIDDKELVGGHLRSLLLTDFDAEWFHRPRVAAGFHPNKLKYTRVLALEKIQLLEFKGKHKMISNTIHLRYLSLRCSDSSVLLLFTGGILEHLQTLDLRNVIESSPNLTETLSSMLRNMGRQLQHLYLPHFRRQANEKLRLDGVSNLETLEYFDPGWCETKDLVKLTNLRKLITNVYSSNVSDLEEILNYLQSSQASKNLRYSSLVIADADSIAKGDKGKTLLRQLWAPNCKLHRLHISGPYPLQQLATDDADINTVRFSSNLTVLYFQENGLKEDPMPTLERIPNLRRLNLYGDAYVGKEMVCSATGFPRLRYLEILHLNGLREWRVYDGAMRNLSELHINGLQGLKMVPDGFRFLSALTELKIGDRMSDSFLDGIQSGSVPGQQFGQDFYKIRHVPRIIIYDAARRRNKKY